MLLGDGVVTAVGLTKKNAHKRKKSLKIQKLTTVSFSEIIYINVSSLVYDNKL